MKYLIVFISLVLFSEMILGQGKQVEVIMKDGSKLEGFAEIPDFGDKNIKFKTEESGKSQKIESKSIRTLIFKTDEETLEMEYLYCKMNETITIVVEWGWLKVVSRGTVNMYKGCMPNPSGTTRRSENNFDYCYRGGEKYALLIPTIGFASKMSKFFDDYPELSKKIKDKTDNYREANITEIIAEYNAWKESTK